MSNRPAVSKRLEKALFQEVGSRCPLCGEEDVSALVIHHIEPYAENPAHDPSKMIVLCSNCHARADRGDISRVKLLDRKQRLAKVVPFPHQTSTPSPQTVIGQGNIVAGHDIQVDHLHIRPPRIAGKGRATIIPGTVATDPFKIGYLKHLAKRYNKFKEYEVGKKQMRYSLIYQAYESEMKYSIEQTPLQLFETASRYLQSRIKNTKLGRIRKKQGKKLYSLFEEFPHTDVE